jgi:hypothetical protein
MLPKNMHKRAHVQGKNFQVVLQSSTPLASDMATLWLHFGLHWTNPIRTKTIRYEVVEKIATINRIV